MSSTAMVGWLALLFLVIYALTANRGIQWQDSGYHILRVVSGESLNPKGLALTHPLHHWLSRILVGILPVEPAYAVTLVSALAAAFTVANVFGCVHRLTGQAWAAIWAALSLAVANVFWQLATIAETYTLVTALLTAELWCVIAFLQSGRSRFIAAAALFNGLGVANHMLAALTLPVLATIGILAFARRSISPGVMIASSLCWLLGAAPYLLLIVGQIVETGDAPATLRSALFGRAFAGNVLNIAPPWQALAISLAFLVLSFPNLLIPAAAYGIIRQKACSKSAMRALSAALLIHLVFAARYDVVDQYMFFLPSYSILAIIGGVGAHAWIRAGGRRIITRLAILLVAASPILSAFAPMCARQVQQLGGMVHRKPYRDDFVYLLTPWSVVKDSAYRMSRQAVELAGNNGLIIIEDGMARFAVQYIAHKEQRNGVTITTEPQAAQIVSTIDSGAPVVLVPLDRERPTTAAPIGTWKRVGDLYLMQPIDGS